MLEWLTNKRRTGNQRASIPLHRKTVARAHPLGIESLETRSLMTVAPFVGPVDLPTLSAKIIAPIASTPTLPVSIAPPVTTTTSADPSAPTLSPTQVADETAAGQAIDAFGLDLYKALQAGAGGSGNMFVSPFSISTALAMAYAGARGETAAQMADVLHLSGDPARIAADFGTLLTDLNSAGQGDYALSVADALWGQQGLPFLSEFLNTMQTDYGGGLNQVDFKNQAEAVRQTINDWVAQHTNDKIQDLFPKGSIDALTRLVLTNAIYFKGNWATAFDPTATYDANFALASGTAEQVSTMHATQEYSYMQSDGFQVLELPYAGGRLAMNVLLPTTAGGTAGLNLGQLPDDLSTWLSGLSPQQVDVSLPKFTLTTQFDLGGQLGSLGMTDAFDKHLADFTGVTDAERLYISQVVHKAYIAIDETGTEAAAATGVIEDYPTIAGIWPPIIPIQFNADHPFLFLIRDTQSGSVLFMGQEADPLKNGGDSSAPPVDTQIITPEPVQLPITQPLLPIAPAPPIYPDPVWSAPQPIFIGPVMPPWLRTPEAPVPSPPVGGTSQLPIVGPVFRPPHIILLPPVLPSPIFHPEPIWCRNPRLVVTPFELIDPVVTNDSQSPDGQTS